MTSATQDSLPYSPEPETVCSVPQLTRLQQAQKAFEETLEVLKRNASMRSHGSCKYEQFLTAITFFCMSF